MSRGNRNTEHITGNYWRYSLHALQDRKSDKCWLVICGMLQLAWLTFIHLESFIKLCDLPISWSVKWFMCSCMYSIMYFCLSLMSYCRDCANLASSYYGTHSLLRSQLCQSLAMINIKRLCFSQSWIMSQALSHPPKTHREPVKAMYIVYDVSWTYFWGIVDNFADGTTVITHIVLSNPLQISGNCGKLADYGIAGIFDGE